MNRRILIPLAVVLLAALAALLWWRSRDDDETAARTDETSAAPAPSQPKSYGGDTQEPPPQRLPDVAMDEDPEGPLRLEGQVVDGDKIPVAGAVVTLSSNPPRTTTSEQDGSFHFDDLIGKTYALTARADGRVGGPVAHGLTETSDPVIITVEPGATLRVEVVSAGADEPIAGATVQLRSGETRTEVTGPDGIAELRGVGTGFTRVRVEADGFGPVVQPVQIPDSPGIEVDTRVLLRPGAPVAGRVVSPDGTPIEGASVVARDVSAALSMVDPELDGTLTDADGRFRFDAVAAGTYRFAARHAGHAPGSTEPIIVDGQTPHEGVKVVMEPGGVVAGRVVDAEGAPAAWASVRVAPVQQGMAMMAVGAGTRGATADEDGTFEVTGLPRTELRTVAIGDDASSEVVRVDLRERERERADVELVLSIDDGIAGVVVDSDDEPVPEVQVTAFPDFFGGNQAEDFALRGMARDTTDGAGRFSVRGLPEGTYRLRTDRRSGWSTFMQSGVQAATGDTDVRLVLADDGGLEGTVQFVDGGAPELFTVTIGYPPGVPVGSDDGGFDLDGIPPGMYDVTFRGPEFARVVKRDVEIEPGQSTDLGTVEVKRGRAVSGRVVGPDDAPVAGAAVAVGKQLFGDGKSISSSTFSAGADEMWGVRRAQTDGDGRFTIGGISTTDELVIVAEHPEIGRSVPQPIQPGRDNPTVELALRPFGSVAGTVTVGGEPSGAAMVVAASGDTGRQGVMVQTGEDGSYVIEKLPEGPHKLTATLGAMTGTRTASRDVDIVGGQRATADIDIEAGDIQLTVTIQGEGGAEITAAQVLMMKGRVKSGSAKDLQQAFMSQSDRGGLNSAFSMGGNPAELDDVLPGDYSLCAIPIPGDLSDPTFQQRLQEHADQLEVHCEQHTVAESPESQSATVTVPPPAPLPEPTED